MTCHFAFAHCCVHIGHNIELTWFFLFKDWFIIYNILTTLVHFLIFFAQLFLIFLNMLAPNWWDNSMMIVKIRNKMFHSLPMKVVIIFFWICMEFIIFAQITIFLMIRRIFGTWSHMRTIHISIPSLVPRLSNNKFMTISNIRHLIVSYILSLIFLQILIFIIL